jgi:hypothetical protein
LQYKQVNKPLNILIHGVRQGRKNKSIFMKRIELNQMELISGGGKYAKLCGAGVAATLFGGVIVALIVGPSTIGLCMAAYYEKD